MLIILFPSFFFFFNDTATTEIYTLSLHDALPISPRPDCRRFGDYRRKSHRSRCPWPLTRCTIQAPGVRDRKSTRLNSSHQIISYAVFCLKKKKKNMLMQYVYECRRSNLGSSLMCD